MMISEKIKKILLILGVLHVSFVAKVIWVAEFLIKFIIAYKHSAISKFLFNYGN